MSFLSSKRPARVWRGRRDTSESERGVAAVMMVIMIVAILGVSALVVDYGNWALARRQLQSAADAGALAGVRDLPNAQVARASAVSLGGQYNAAGATVVIPNADVLIGVWNNTTKTFVETPTNPNAIKVRARRDSTNPAGPINSYFAGALGKTSTNVAAEAIAINGTPTQASIIPMALRASQSFGPIDPQVAAANPGKDGPSYPTHPNPADPNAKFDIGDKVTIMLEGKGKKSPIHLTLEVPGDEHKILRGEDPAPAVNLNDQFYTVNNNGVISAILKRMDYASTDPLRTVVMPIVGTTPGMRNGSGDIVGQVKVVGFTAVHLDAEVEADVPDPDKPGKTITIRYLEGTIVTQTVPASSVVASAGPLSSPSLITQKLVA